MARYGLFLLLASLFVYGAAAHTPDHLPKTLSLRNAPCNVRVGPGRHFPIRWVFQKAHMPVQILAKFQDWYKIKDMDAAVGWIHKSMLSQKAYVIFQASLTQLHKKPSSNCTTVAKIRQGVLARLKSCQDGWCDVQIIEHNIDIKGFVPQTALWPYS